MPEGPEVETIRRDIEPLVVNKVIISTWTSTLSFRRSHDQEFLSRLKNTSIQYLGRHGKLMWADTGDDRGFFIRLGMTGRLRVSSHADKIEAHTHVRVGFEDGSELRYVDPRRFGDFYPMVSKEKLVIERSRLGPDPLNWNAVDRQKVFEKIRRSSRSIKNILLDQNVLAGVGNIYASEALFVAGIAPYLCASQISQPRLKKLLAATEEVMRIAVENRGTTFMSYVDGNGKRGDNLSRLWVFAREHEPCKICGQKIERLVQTNRSTFWCPKCQVGL